MVSNVLVLLFNRGRQVMAGLLLWWGMAFLCGGCLVPQDDQVLPTLPPRLNSPPRIIRGLVRPAQREAKVYTGAGCRTEFAVVVEDTDLGDTLRSRWFIDPNNEYTSTPGTFAQDGPRVPGGTEPTRTMKEAPQLQTALTGLTDSQAHRLEVWVTDGEFSEYNDPPPGGLTVVGQMVTMPDGGQVENPAFFDSYEWLVTVEANCPP
jgi:hypothetical protein